MLAINGLRQFHYLLARGGESYCKTNYRDALNGFADKRKKFTEEQYPVYAQIWMDSKKNKVMQTALSPLGILLLTDASLIIETIDENQKRFLGQKDKPQ